MPLVWDEQPQSIALMQLSLPVADRPRTPMELVVVEEGWTKPNEQSDSAEQPMLNVSVIENEGYA